MADARPILVGRGGPAAPPLPLRRADIDLLGNISRYRDLRTAARHSAMTEASAGRRLAALTRRVGARLVLRERGRTWLTSDGWLLYRSGRQLVDVLDHVLAGARGSAAAVSRLTPLLRVASGVGDDVTLIDLFADWLPGVVVDLVGTALGGPVAAFEQYRVDAACWWSTPTRPGPTRRPARVVSVLTEPLWVALPAGHRNARSAVVPLADLAAETWVLAPGPDGALPGRTAAGPTGTATAVARGPAGAAPAGSVGAGRRSGPAGPAVLAAASLAHQRSLVGQGQGVALVSPLAAPRRPDTGLALRPVHPPQGRRLHLAVDPVTVPPLVADRLRAALRAHYAEQARRLNPEYAGSPAFPVPDTDPPGGPAGRSAGPALGIPLQRIGSPPRPPADSPALAVRSTRIEPEHLHLLDVVATAGSVNRAAGMLLVSQPSLVRRLRRLERGVGLTLLHASPRGTQLSEVAQALLTETADARHALATVIAQLRPDAAAGGQPRLDIAT